MSTRPATLTSVAVLQHAEPRGLILRVLVSLFVAAGMIATFAVTARGQQPQFETIKMHPAFSDEKILKRMERAAGGLVGHRGDVNAFAEMTYAKVYFDTYVPAKITQPDAVGEVSTLVSNAVGLLSRAQRSKAPGAGKILPWVYAGMKRVAEGNYQPAARINATLVLGRLDEQPADNIAQKPPVPLRYSLPILLKLYQDANNPDGVRAAALQGLHRYVSYVPTLSAQDRGALTTAMTELLASDVPNNRSPQAHAYLKRFAVDMLATLGKADDPQFGSQLISISKEAEQPDLIALYSAARVGSMKKGLEGQIDAPQELLASWSVRAMRAFQTERSRLKAMTRPVHARQPAAPSAFLKTETSASTAQSERSTGGGGGGEGGMANNDYGEDEEYEDMDDVREMMSSDGGGFGRIAAKANPQPPEVMASRRKLNHVLQQLHMGVTGAPTKGMPKTPGGLLAAVDEANKQPILDWITAMEIVVSDLNDGSLDDRAKFAAGLAVQVKALAALAGDDAVEAADKALEDKGIPIPDAEALVEDAEPAAVPGLVAPGLPAANDAGVPTAMPVVDELAAP